MTDKPKVYVYLWFDIEDYVTRDADGLPIIAFEILDKHNVRPTCKIVAEKVRRLRENGRDDVISAISKYDVGYHLNTHSQHPTLYEYLADGDVLTGAKEFMARESEGFELVKQVFARTPSCFGHPGPIWTPHVYPALKEMGIPVYLDETGILNLNDQPYWYCGILNLNGANRNFIVFDFTFQNPNGIKELKRKFKTIHARLSKNGGAVSLLFHLHTAINMKFWDEVNFANGKNMERVEYEEPPRQPEEVTQRAWKNFEELIQYISSFEDVEFITASDAAQLYRDPNEVTVGATELKLLAKHFGSSASYLRIGRASLSPAAGFYAVVKAIAQYADTGNLPEKIIVKEAMGPISLERSRGRRKMTTRDFLAAGKTVLDAIESEGFLPASITVGDYAELAPHDYLPTACKLLSTLISRESPPETIYRLKGRQPQVEHVSSANFTKACKWKVLPHNFKAPKILEQAKLQAWTLRPAILTSPTDLSS